ncbi:MAG TPA: HAMP domain-containing sensor histidine kinase [Candidatus Limnocylindrales bacterium]|nr:HAMP domain-containing sensor histidine kinase [Candidatus Limnocylindrales bacterium]
MLKIPFKRLFGLHQAAAWQQGGNLQRRFIIRVLAPPFFILLIFGLLGLWQINRYITNQAIGELNRSAISTAAKLEREFAIRQTVLKRTGEDLFKIKNDYLKDRQALDKNRQDCSAYVKQKKTYTGAPNGICDPFLPDFTSKGASLQVIEDSYVRMGAGLTQAQEQKIKDRLSAYNQFFPETRVLLVADAKQQIVSSAASGNIKTSNETFLTYLGSVNKQSLEGRLTDANDLRLAVFAYPINGGSVLAAYDLDSPSFIRQTWESTPIDRSKALAVILDASGQTAFPDVKPGDSFQKANTVLRKGRYSQVNLKGIKHIAVGAEAGTAQWLVVVASPQAVVFGPLRDAQLAAALIIGSLLVGFLWVGAIFIQRTVRSIMQLVSGALLFAGGKLDYSIHLPSADKEFAQLAETMNIMAWRIADAEKEIDKKNKEFISIATHELRTPLTAIVGNLSMAMEDYGDKLHGPVKSIIEHAHTGTLRLRDLVNDMLDMARLDGGRVEFVIEKQDIQKVIEDITDTLHITAKEQHVKLKYKDHAAGPVMADAGKLRIVLNNFISNAIKYNRPGGTVKIFHEHKDGMLITAVKDTGLGIPDEQKAHIFEKFFRVNNADRENVTGTGLGMYITRRYVLAMGGQVWFESVHGQGTTFYFSLRLPENSKVPKQPNPPLLAASHK